MNLWDVGGKWFTKSIRKLEWTDEKAGLKCVSYQKHTIFITIPASRFIQGAMCSCWSRLVCFCQNTHLCKRALL